MSDINAANIVSLNQLDVLISQIYFWNKTIYSKK